MKRNTFNLLANQSIILLAAGSFAFLGGCGKEILVGDEAPLSHGDGSAKVVLGDEIAEIPEPIADEAYLCTDENGLHCDEDEVLSGVPYSIRGASFENGRLRFFALGSSPWEGWCALQMPHTLDDSVPVNECYFEAISSGGWEDGNCMMQEEIVDCDWQELLREFEVCDCTSAGCFPGKVHMLGDIEMDLTLSESGSEFVGSLANGERVQLFQEQ